MKTIPFLEDLLFGSEILFCPRGIINKPTVYHLSLTSGTKQATDFVSSTQLV
jgi:hypothetical protein